MQEKKREWMERGDEQSETLDRTQKIIRNTEMAERMFKYRAAYVHTSSAYK